MKAFVIVLALASVSFLTSIAHADGRPERTTHEGDTGPGPTPSTPGDGGGSGDITHWERPSRDVDHGSSSSCCESSYDSSSSYGSSSSYDSYDSGRYSGGSYTSVACAPGDIQSNVVATDKALKSLAASKEFATASKFQNTVKGIASIKNPAARSDAYLKLAGINAKDTKAIVAFVGAREARGTWIVELQRSTGLSEAQAVKTAVSLQTALRGGLN